MIVKSIVKDTPTLLQMMEEAGEECWGFVLFRATYKDQQEWDTFLRILNEQTREYLEREDATDMMQSLDWAVQEDATMDGADHRVIREQFKTWVERHGGPNSTPRSQVCGLVDQECIDSVLTDPSTSLTDERHPPGFIKLVDIQWDEGEENEAELAKRKFAAPLLDGSRRDDLGWMKVATRLLAPRGYVALSSDAWGSGLYYRPPAIAEF